MSADQFNKVLVEETERLNQTVEIKALAEEAMMILKEGTGLEVLNLRYLAKEAKGKVKVAWQVEGIKYHEIFDFRVMRMDHTRKTNEFSTCGHCYPHARQEILVTAFREAKLSVYHSKEFGNHYLEVYLTGKGFSTAVLRLPLYPPVR